MFGRDYRKLVAQTFAFGAFRFIAIWLLVAGCASYGSQGVPAAMVIVAADICTNGAHRGLAFLSIDQSRKDWLDRLTNRMFYKLFWEAVRDGNGRSIEVDHMFAEARREARKDIEKAEEDSRIQSGLFDKPAWHWVGGVLSFLGLTASFGLYYGSAIVIGRGGQF